MMSELRVMRACVCVCTLALCGCTHRAVDGPPLGVDLDDLAVPDEADGYGPSLSVSLSLSVSVSVSVSVLRARREIVFV